MKKPKFPEGRIGKENEVPMKASVFEYRNQNYKNSLFDFILYVFGLWTWWYNIDRQKPMDEQKEIKDDLE